MLWACGDDASDPPDGAAPPPIDAATVSDAVGPPPVPGALRTSYISAYSYDDGVNQSSTVVAQFYDQDPSPIVFTTDTVGPCEIRNAMSAEGGGFPNYFDAGLLRVEGGTQTVELGLDPGGFYDAFTADTALFAGGETLTISAQGSDVPGFTTTVVAPAHVQVTAPVYPVGLPYAVDRSADLTFTWTGTSDGQIRVRFGGPQAPPDLGTTVTCWFSPGDGTGTVPGAALERIQLAGTGTLAVDVVSTSVVTTAGWGAVDITVDTPGLAPTFGAYGTSVDFL